MRTDTLGNNKTSSRPFSKREGRNSESQLKVLKVPSPPGEGVGGEVKNNPRDRSNSSLFLLLKSSSPALLLKEKGEIQKTSYGFQVSSLWMTSSLLFSLGRREKFKRQVMVFKSPLFGRGGWG